MKYLLALIIVLTIKIAFSQNKVKIGNQTWMTENLNVSTFRNGDPIPEAKTAEEWKMAGLNKQPVWCYYDNDPKNETKYGKLYNWYAVNDTRGLAPVGTHIPTMKEWDELSSFLGVDAAKKLKSSIVYDNLNSCVGTNESGFTANPGAICYDNGSCRNYPQYAQWWSSTTFGDVDPWLKDAYQFSLKCRADEGSGLNKAVSNKSSGMAVRCISDTPAEINNSTISVVTSTNSTSNQESNTKTIVYSNSVYWGGVVNNKCEGNGVIQFNNGDLYEGNFLNDLKNGFGTFYFSNGDRYEGNWVDDKRSGQGTYFFNNGDRFVGQFIDGKKTDNGTYSYGVDKKGCISGDCQNGTGKKVFTNGVYEGQFKNGKFHGKGKYNYPNKSTYDGDWQDGVKQGKGQYVWYNGDFYIGDFQNDKKQGYGVYYWGKGNSDGAKYSGGWYEGERTGWGVFTFKNGTVEEGNFDKGIYKGKEIQRMVDTKSKPTTTATTGVSNYSEKEIVEIYEKFMKDLKDGKYNEQLLTMSLNYLDTAKIDRNKFNQTSTSSSSNSNSQTKKTNKCSSCNGTGKHSECNKKSRTSYFTETCSIERVEKVNSGYVLCSQCYGFGVTGSCPGKTCYYCKGSGWMACRSNSCDEGVCNSCKGTGQY
jgi:uncharacterized protein (TIGR02145 family)